MHDCFARAAMSWCTDPAFIVVPYATTIALVYIAETKQWVEFFGQYLDRWKERIINWVLTNKEHPVHVVNYEELQNNTVGEVEKILDFLHFPYNHSDLVERLRVDFTTFRRLHMNDGFQHFLPEQKQQLRETITNLLSMAKAVRKADLFIFQRYLSDLAYIN